MYVFMPFVPVRKTDFSALENKVYRHSNAWEKKVNSCKIKKERAAYSVLKWMYEPCPLVEYLWL